MDLLEQIFGSAKADVSPLQMTARAVVIALYGLVVLRMIGRRLFARWTALDVVLSVLVGSNLSRALTGNAPLLGTLVATTVLLVLYWIVVHLAYRSETVSWLVKGRPAVLAENGRVDWQVMRRYGLGPRELEEALRENGATDVAETDQVLLERNGKITVIPR